MISIHGAGRIGRDAELRSAGGTSVCNIAVAFDAGFGDRKVATWVEIAIWGKQAEGLVAHLTKGKGVVISAKDLKLETFNKNDGAVGTKLTATLQELAFMPDGNKADAPPPPPPKPVPPPQPSYGFDDDIPF